MIGLGLGIKIIGGSASAAPVLLSAPFGYNYTVPFNVYRSTAGVYSHSFSMDAVKPTATVTLYCGPGGDNSKDGLSWANRVRSLKQLIVRIQAQSGSAVVRCLVQVGTYKSSSVDGGGIQDSFYGSYIERDVIFEPCDANGNVLTGGTTASRRVISLHDQTMPAWALVSGSVYASTYTTEVPAPGCFDLSKINSKGCPQALHYAPPASSYANEAAIVAGVAAMAAAYGHGACWIDATNKKYYVQTFDGRAPDANIVVTRGGINTNGANARNLYLIGRYGGTQTVWARDLHLWGGAPLYAAAQFSGEGRIVAATFADSSFSYSCINGYNADGAGIHTLLRCAADDNYKDGYNYDQASGFDASGTAVMRFHEMDCTADWNGNSSQSEDSDNASSCHVRTKGVRINVVANRTLNRAFHDIAATQTWNLGCVAQDCRLTGDAASGAFASGLAAGTSETSEVWLDGCQSINNDYDLEAYKGGKLYYANMNTTGFVNQTVGGTITTYNSPPVVPGATGALSATALTSSTVQLSFTDASGASSHQYRVNGGAAATLAGDKIVTGLTQSTAYTFEVRGVNSDGYGAWSNVANATTPASPTPTNILLNGDFSSGTTNWTGFGFSGKSVTGGKAVFASTGAFDGINQSLAALVAGKYYDVTYTISGYSAGTVYAYFSGGTGRNGTTRSANGTYTERLLCNSGNNNFGFQANAGPATLSVDDFGVVGPYDTP